jgi:hypothetical protein
MAEGYTIYVTVCDPSLVPVRTILYNSHHFASAKRGKLFPGCFAKSLFFLGGIDAVHADANGFERGIQYIESIAVYNFNHFSGDGDERRIVEGNKKYQYQQQHGTKVLFPVWRLWGRGQKSGMRLSRGNAPGTTGVG